MPRFAGWKAKQGSYVGGKSCSFSENGIFKIWRWAVASADDDELFDHVRVFEGKHEGDVGTIAVTNENNLLLFFGFENLLDVFD